MLPLPMPCRSLGQLAAADLSSETDHKRLQINLADSAIKERNLLMFMVHAQRQQGDLAGALQSLEKATEIGAAIGFELFQQGTEQIRAELQNADSLE